MSLILSFCFICTLWYLLSLAIHSLRASPTDAKKLFEHLYDIIRVVLCHVYVITQWLKSSSIRRDIIFSHLIFTAFFCGKELRSGGKIELWGRSRLEENEDMYTYLCVWFMLKSPAEGLGWIPWFWDYHRVSSLSIKTFLWSRL